MDELQSLTEAERQLLQAVESGTQCDLSEGDTLGTVRAVVLKKILTGEGTAWGISAGAPINLRGAFVRGYLGGLGGIQLPPIRMESCKFGDTVDFSGATFTGEARFNGVTFTCNAGFNGVTFGDAAWFEGATFIGAGGFESATFGGAAFFGGAFEQATFRGEARFAWASFASLARFGGVSFARTAGFERAAFNYDTSFEMATFARTAMFEETTFAGDAEFFRAVFTGDARFNGATFSGKVGFKEAIFTDDAVFAEVTFTDDADFDDVTVTGAARFDGATFAGDAKFDGALANRLSFSRALFSAADPGPWIASAISLDRAIVAVRSRISITATEIDASRLQAREGAHLLLHSARVDLCDSEFLRRSIISSPGTPGALPYRWQGESAEEAAAVKLRDDLESEFAVLPPRCRITSLARANIGELVLSDVILDECAFVGAHGLDKLRIGTGCSFRETDRWWGSRRMVRRAMIAEELQWREAHTRWADQSAHRLSLPAVEIAEIYRDLRKGLEDKKNEPGAADFYYGEMEMRRLAGREPTGDANETPSLAERFLLYGYWAVAGYGLRASRALLTLAALITVAALLYTMPAFATVTPPPSQISHINPSSGAVTYTPTTERVAPEFWPALEYSARESISLLQTRAVSSIETTGVGTILDFVLRLAGPVLLAFAILALRARTKR